MRKGELSLSDALMVQKKAEALLLRREFLVKSEQVLRFVSASTCSAYDCEFVALAQQLRVPLVTFDRQVLAAFPAIAIGPGKYAKDGL
jgi:predicted nucleic acid-binding protein